MSPVSLVLGFVNLTLWLIWAVLVHDSGTQIAVSATWFVGAFNLVWYLLRRTGLRAFFPRNRAVASASAAEPVPVAVAACE